VELLKPTPTQLYSEDPWLARYDGWLSPKTLRRIKKRCLNSVAYETGRVKTPDGHEVTDFRRADNYVIRDHSDPCLASLAAQVADFIGWHPDYMEPGVLVRYQVGGYFKPHRDWNVQVWNKTTSHRIATFMIYLNDDFQGGTTTFHSLGTFVQPKAGTAIYYDYRPGEICDDKLTHSGDPVTSGTKYVICFFIRDLPFLGRQRDRMTY